MRKIGIQFMLVLPLLFVACAAEDEVATNGSQLDPLTLTADFADGEGTTRATADGTWTLNALIAVKTSDGVKQYKVNNVSTGELLPNNASGSNANTHYWHSLTESKAVSAWYYGDGTYNATLKAITVPATQDQNTVQNYDLLYAKNSISYTDRADNTKNCLTFYHQMAKVTVNVKRSNEAASYNVNSVTLGSSTFCRTGTFSEPSSGSYGTWSLGTSNKSTVTAYKQTTPTSGYDYTFTALVVPQSVSGGLPISLDITTLGAKSLTGPSTISPGNHYTYNVTIDKQGVVVNSSTITDWAKPTAASINNFNGYSKLRDYYVGWFYYSDGTCLPYIDYTVTPTSAKHPIGVIVYVNDGTAYGDAITEKSAGYGHALVCCAEEEEVDWASSSTASTDLTYNSLFPNIQSLAAAKTDYSGLAKTNYLASLGSGKYPAAYAAKNYGSYEGDGEYSWNAPSSSSGWFLPSVGQWIAVMKAWGVSESSIKFDAAFDLEDFQTRLNNKITQCYDNCGLGGYYWTSSEYSGIDAVIYYMNRGESRFTNEQKTNGCYVRPFLAF